MPVTMELDGKKTELPETPNQPDYNSVSYVPKPEEPSIRKPAPVVRPEPGSSTRARSRKPKDRQDQARTKAAPVVTTPEVTEARKNKVSEVLTIASGSLLLAGKTYGNVSLRADGHAVAALTQPFSEAVAQVAAYDPTVARLLDHEGSQKAAAYVGLVSVTMTLGSQLAANHGLIKPGVMNTVAPDVIVAAMEPAQEAPADDNATRP